MRFLADENIPRLLVRALRDLNHDLVAAKESMRGKPDEAILEAAGAEGRVIITQDKDFGELAFRRGLPAASGIVLFRLEGMTRDAAISHMLRVLTSRSDWEGRFAVVTGKRIRVRALPSLGHSGG
jgi:predicted nuclease of predicted toxin-antitoxin system